jgi:hypothetical protein
VTTSSVTTASWSYAQSDPSVLSQQVHAVPAQAAAASHNWRSDTPQRPARAQVSAAACLDDVDDAACDTVEPYDLHDLAVPEACYAAWDCAWIDLSPAITAARACTRTPRSSCRPG